VKGSAPSSSGGQKGGGQQSGGNDAGVAGGKNVFLKVTADKSNVYRGEGVVVTCKLYTKVSLYNPNISKLPSFNGFLEQEIQLPQMLLNIMKTWTESITKFMK